MCMLNMDSICKNGGKIKKTIYSYAIIPMYVDHGLYIYKNDVKNIRKTIYSYAIIHVYVEHGLYI